MFSLEPKAIEVPDHTNISEEDTPILIHNLGSFSATLHNAAALRKSNQKSEKNKKKVPKKVKKPENNYDDFDLIGLDVNPTPQANQKPQKSGNDMNLLNVDVGNIVPAKDNKASATDGNGGLLDLMGDIQQTQPVTSTKVETNDFMDLDVGVVNPEPKKEEKKDAAPNYDDLLNIDNFQSSLPTQPVKVAPQPKIDQPISNPNTLNNDVDLFGDMGAVTTPSNTNSNPSDIINPGNLDLLSGPTPPPNSNPQNDDLLGFGNNETQNPVNTDDKFNLDILEQPKTSVAPTTNQIPESKVESVEENDDPVWLSENDIDSSGNSGMKVRGKFFETHSGLLKMKITFYNRTGETFRSPRIDLKANFYGMYFVGEGPSFTLDSLSNGNHITVEKGINTSIFLLTNSNK